MTKQSSDAQGTMGMELNEAELASVCGSALAQGRSIRMRPRPGASKQPVGSHGGAGKRPLTEPLGGWEPPMAIPDPVRVPPEDDDDLMGGWSGGHQAEPAPERGGVMAGGSHGVQVAEPARPEAGSGVTGGGNAAGHSSIGTGSSHALESGGVLQGGALQGGALQGGTLQGGTQQGGPHSLGDVATARPALVARFH